MSFYDLYLQHKDFDLKKIFSVVSPGSIQNSLERDLLDIGQYIQLISPQAENCLEGMAQRAYAITRRNFGKTIQLYTPMYLSNYCENSCLYCGFNLNNNIERKKLSLNEVEKEAQFISSSGLKHILILTGESRLKSPVSYIKNCVKILKKYFSSVSIEVYPLAEDEYSELVASGVDGLTIYQEAYDQEVYAKMHVSGPKKDYKFRLEAPERGAKSRMRNISIGALLGLGDWRREVFFLGLHAKYLQDKFPDIDIGVSVPRIQPQVGDFKPISMVSDKNIAQIILALRNFLPRIGITLSTRENPDFREALIPLGITKISAGSTTAVGGHTLCVEHLQKYSQFEIQDQRSVDEIRGMLECKGYQPVFKDWLNF
ncbi:MAG: 2-iminoacetate synthase ThiH [Candidatus Omnitrophica bacterium]|jgi:2-iminoacetate synthase|nr:2-iminoacetate synthase ThiH [Candidatus Omnitrophota bacterium]MDD5661156.1 2-iminoacetate synthase ThiH [Candidatus Omnitrophota bacterium]